MSRPKSRAKDSIIAQWEPSRSKRIVLVRNKTPHRHKKFSFSPNYGQSREGKSRLGSTHRGRIVSKILSINQNSGTSYNLHRVNSDLPLVGMHNCSFGGDHDT